ncbi:MAG: EAL domain-containing protein [Myxococcota bacterium]|nr:EAL domain-containing protein [Myxococcota bacterium]
MGKLIRSKEWARTPLGPIHGWPQSLTTTVSLCLASNFPICLVWGDEQVQIYNDGYWPICGAKHPQSMGQDFRECWASAWPVIGKAFERALTGEASYLEDQRMFLDRNGYLEEAFFTFSFSPIRDETGRVGGLFHPVTETTSRMVNERRTRALRDLAACAAKAQTTEDAFRIAADTLSAFDLDLPLALFYSLDAEGTRATLTARTGLSPDTALTASAVNLDAASEASWPLRSVVDTNQIHEVHDLKRKFGPFVCGPYPEPPKVAIVHPITQPGGERPIGVAILGVSSRLPFDETYRTFLDLLTGSVTAAVANALAHDEARKRADAMAEIDRAKTEFFSNVSHEFRTPLTLMLGPLEDELAEQIDPLPAARFARLQTAHRNSLRLLKLVNTLLDFSRLEAGRTQAAYEATDLKTLTGHLASAFRSAIEKAGLEFNVDCASLPEAVYVDRDMWEKITLNLLSNATKFTLSGRISLRLQPAGDHVEMSVEDTGCGIPPSELENVFKRFHRVQGTQGRTHEGTGIGLSLVEELVKLHGGSVRVTSVLGQGSTFTVSVPFGNDHLPAQRVGTGQTSPTSIRPDAYVGEAIGWLPQKRDASAETSAAITAPAGGAKPRPHVLVADDNADMREYVRTLLGALYDVVTVPDGEAAWVAIHERRPDLLLTDVMMPKLDGFGLLARLRANASTRTLPVILVSARAGDESLVDGLEAGADDYMNKPFSARELVARVRTSLEIGRFSRLLEQSNAALREAQAIAHLGSWEWDVAANTLEWSAEMYAIYGLPQQRPLTYEGYLERILPADRDVARGHIERASREGGSFRFEHRIVRPDGVIRVVQANGRVFKDQRGAPVRMTGTGEDITLRKSSEERLSHLATHDILTNLPNRSLLRDRLTQAIARPARHDRFVGVLFVDLDRFKLINDTLGHHFGDQLLIGVARRLESAVRDGDTVGRLGGDEFVVILADVAKVIDLTVIADKFIRLLSTPFPVESHELHITASIGISYFPNAGLDADTLIEHADASMYRAKELGKNNYQHYSADIQSQSLKRFAMEGAIRRGLERNEFAVHYQPLVDLRTGGIIGLEALVRWNHPELGLVSPSEFIPLAEETGLIVPLGEWVLRTACAQNKVWQSQGLPSIQIAVNVAARQFQEKGLVDAISRVLEEVGMDARWLILELTESSLMKDSQGAIATMHALRERGIELAVDDFGTGYSSLNYLTRFPINGLKIDRAFIRNITTDVRDRLIATTILGLGHGLELKVVAEGIETVEQLELLSSIGCDQMQGYLFSPPVPGARAEEMLRTRKRLPLR